VYNVRLQQICAHQCNKWLSLHTYDIPHIGDSDNTTRIMDSGRIEDLLQQYMTQLQNLRGEPRTGRGQQDQNGTNQHGSGTTNGAIPAEISRVAARLPPFWAELPAVRFAQAEAQFTLAGIGSEQNKFCYVISQLYQRYASEVEDIITSPPKRDPYTTLRIELVRLVSPSKEHSSHEFLTLGMGNCKPSQFLRHLRSVSPDMPDDLLRSIWSSQLPSHLRAVLTGKPEGDFDIAARCADRIIEAAPRPILASVAQPHENHDPQEYVKDIRRQVKALHAELDRVSSNTRAPCSSSRNRRSVSRSSSREVTPTLCSYHSRYRSQAQKCMQPCAYRQQEN
jgi:hypothetical protein